MRTLLTLNRRNKYGYILQSRTNYSRSFIRGMMQGLYLSHAHTLYTVPITVTDVMGSTTRQVDSDSYNFAAPQAWPKTNMVIAAPPGGGQVLMDGGSLPSASTWYLTDWSKRTTLGENVGIVIGRGNAAAATTDTRLSDRIGHGRGQSAIAGPVSMDSFLLESNNTFQGDTDNGLIGMIYTPRRQLDMTAIKFKVFRSNSPGNVTVRVYGIKQRDVSFVANDSTIIAESNPVNANLWTNSPPGAMEQFDFASPVRLEPGFRYAIAIYPSRASANNYVNIRYQTGSQNINSRYFYSFTLGTQLTIHSDYAITFDIIGGAGATMEYGGMDIYGLTIVNPNGQFSLRRIFNNLSGEPITVQEAGIYIPLSRYWPEAGGYSVDNFIICAARDVFAPIVVNDSENLELIYTPSITV